MGDPQARCAASAKSREVMRGTSVSAGRQVRSASALPDSLIVTKSQRNSRTAISHAASATDTANACVRQIGHMMGRQKPIIYN